MLVSGFFCLSPTSVAKSAEEQPTPQPPENMQNKFPMMLDWQDLFPNWLDQQGRDITPVLPISVASRIILEKDPELKTRLLDEVKGYENKRYEDLASGQGWVYRMARYFSKKDGDDILYEKEGWYLLEPWGTIHKAYERVFNLDGQVIEENIFKDGLWKKSGFTTIEFLMNPEINRFDFGFANRASQMVLAGSSLSRTTLYENCWYMGELYTLSDGINRLTALYYPDTGKIRKLEAWQLNSEKIESFWTLTLPIEENIEQPPAWVVEFFIP